MRILWLKSDLLLPLDKGGKLRTWHLMRHLAKRHEITYLAFADHDQIAAAGADAGSNSSGRPKAKTADAIEGMREVAAHVETVPRREPVKGTLRFYAGAALRVLDPLPYAVGRYRSRAYAARIRELLASTSFDLIVCDFLPPVVSLPERLPCPAVLFTHNVESEIWRRHAEVHSGFPARLLYRMQYRRMLRFEARALRRFDAVLTVSEADRATFARLYPGAVQGSVYVVSTGVDTQFFSPEARDAAGDERPSAADSRRLVFTGSMDWLPNEDAMLFFCREVLPLIRAEEPEVTLSIVGRTPTPAVKKLADLPGVYVTGRVDDVRPYIREAAAYIVPLRIGGGTRLKIFEAMAMGKAVVSTTVGAEGLPVSGGEHVILADEPRSFSRAVVRLLRDVDRRRQFEAAARALVVERYDWSAVAGELESALACVAAPRSSATITTTANTAGERVAVSASPKRSTVGADLRAGPEPIHPR
jgi:sugar transferase (PEP-CTERM/EpsH1 system associated)